MKIKNRHIIIFSIIMFAIGTGLFVNLPFISTNTQSLIAKKTFKNKINFEKLCSVDVDENGWKYIILHHSATDEGNAKNFDDYHREKKKWKYGLAYHFVIGNGTDSRDGEIEESLRTPKLPWRLLI